MPPILPQWLLRIPSIRRGSTSPALPSSAELEWETQIPTVKVGRDLGLAILDLFGRAVTPSNVYVTLSITRAETTYTTTILLAGTGTDAPVTPAPVATTTAAVVGPVVTTTVAVNGVFSTAPAPAPTAQPVSAAPTSTDPSSATIVGAIVGSIVGSFLLIFFWWLFCARGRVFGNSSYRSSSGSSRSDDSL